MLLQLLQHLSIGCHVLFVFVLSVDEDVIKIHYHQNVELFSQNFINVDFKCDRCIGQFKKHYLIFEMAIAAFEGCLLVIAFFDPHLIVNIGQIKLSKMSSLTYSI